MPGYPCCCEKEEEECTACDGGKAPTEYQVEIAGIVNGTCGDCTDLNDTYVLEWVEQSGAICYWEYVLPAPICNVVAILLGVDGTLDKVFVQLMQQTYPDGLLHIVATAEKSFGVDVPCMDLDAEAIGAFTFQFPYATDCDGAASTCAVTAL
jgi:hypothetical protein